MKMNKIITIALMVFSVMGIQTAEAQSSSPSTKWHWDKGTIVVETPERPAGQEPVLGLTAKPIKKYVWLLSDWVCVVHQLLYVSVRFQV